MPLLQLPCSKQYKQQTNWVWTCLNIWQAEAMWLRVVTFDFSNCLPKANQIQLHDAVRIRPAPSAEFPAHGWNLNILGEWFGPWATDEMHWVLLNWNSLLRISVVPAVYLRRASNSAEPGGWRPKFVSTYLVRAPVPKHTILCNSSYKGFLPRHNKGHVHLVSSEHVCSQVVAESSGAAGWVEGRAAFLGRPARWNCEAFGSAGPKPILEVSTVLSRRNSLRVRLSQGGPFIFFPYLSRCAARRRRCIAWKATSIHITMVPRNPGPVWWVETAVVPRFLGDGAEMRRADRFWTLKESQRQEAEQ